MSQNKAALQSDRWYIQWEQTQTWQTVRIPLSWDQSPSHHFSISPGRLVHQVGSCFVECTSIPGSKWHSKSVCMIKAASKTVVKYESLMVLWFDLRFISRVRHETHTMCTLRQMPASVCIKALKLEGGAGLWKYRRRVTAETSTVGIGVFTG